MDAMTDIALHALGNLKAADNGDGTFSLYVIQEQKLAESLWTDDSGAYFVRIDSGGAISWADISGNSVSAPGTGARPAAGTTTLLDKSSFQATAAATGYSLGDLIDHYVVTDPTTGVIIGTFWLNSTTASNLSSAPSSANITPLIGGAATSANQASILSAVQALRSAHNIDDIVSALATNHADEAALHTDIATTLIGIAAKESGGNLAAILAAVQAPQPAGTNSIGATALDATTEYEDASAAQNNSLRRQRVTVADVFASLRNILSAIVSPIWYHVAANATRAMIVSGAGVADTLSNITTVGTVTAVTTVATVTNVTTVSTVNGLTGIGGIGAQTIINDIMMNQWAGLTRRCIT